MRIDPVDVFGHSTMSMPLRLLVAILCIWAGMLSRFALDHDEFRYHHPLESLLFFPFTLANAAVSDGLWGVVAVPCLVATVWTVVTFAYDGRGGAYALFNLYVFAYLIVMFRADKTPTLAILLGATLVIIFSVVNVLRRRDCEIG